jgi:hypothetical protein
LAWKGRLRAGRDKRDKRARRRGRRVCMGAGGYAI